MDDSLRKQARDHHQFVLNLIADNERLQQQVESLTRQLDVLRRTGAATLDSSTARAWGVSLGKHKRWKDIELGGSVWDEAKGYPAGGGLWALYQDLTAIPGDDRDARFHWDLQENRRAKLREEHNRKYGGDVAYERRPYPSRFKNLYDAVTILRQQGDAGLADILSGLLKGLRPNTKLYLAIGCCFLLYRDDAVRVLSEEPEAVVERLWEEVHRATRPAAEATWNWFGDILNRAAAGPSKADAQQILGVGSDATPEDIRRAYRNLARQHHPDMGGTPEAFHKIQEAYRALTA